MRYSCAMTEPAQTQARHIVIVEDEPAIAQNLSDALARHGYRTSTYADRPRAQAGLTTRLPDLAIIDVGLGREPDGGFDLCRWLRERIAQVLGDGRLVLDDHDVPCLGLCRFRHGATVAHR